MGRVFPIVSYTKQKLNTRRSTETELVDADDFMPEICWTLYFLKAQGYRILDNVLFQDNKSSIILEKNRKSLSSKLTKHINIRCLFITDRVAQGNVLLVWCPTGDMIRYFMTKPLQGDLFRERHSRGRHIQEKASQVNSRNNIFSLVLPVGQHHRSVLGGVKNVR